ncbi:hypothetical protein TYRP_004255 [Tyrophagus putrescentiae]|nr:hypothetical protein TYRP_004255 [Tyrophagus putrescentiae]
MAIKSSKHTIGRVYVEKLNGEGNQKNRQLLEISKDSFVYGLAPASSWKVYRGFWTVAST